MSSVEAGTVVRVASARRHPRRTGPGQGLRAVLPACELPLRSLVWAVLLGALGVGCAVALMGFSAWLIARASQHPLVLDLSVVVVSVRAFGIGRALFRYLERLASHSVALSGLVTLRTRLYAALASGDPRLALGLRRGDLLARVGADVDQMGDVVIKGLLPFGIAALVCAGAVLTSLLVLPAAGLGLLVAVLLAGLLSPWLAARSAAQAHAAAVEARAQISAGTLAHLDALDELRVAGAAAASRHVLNRWEDEQVDAVDRAALPAAAAAALQHVAVAIGVLTGLVFGAQAVQSGQIGEVWLAVVALLPLAALDACSDLPTAAAELVAGERAARRLAPLLASEAGDLRAAQPIESQPAAPQVGAAPAAGEAAPLRRATESASTPQVLRARGLQVGWDYPLAGVPGELEIVPGRFLAITGPSGAGKTTLGLTLAGLIRPLGGEVSLGAQPLDDIADLPRRVSFTAHDAHVFGTSLRENLLVAAAAGTDDDALLDAARRAGLGPWIAGLPDGLDTSLAPGGDNLSGGERRRLLLARALLTGSDVLLLDEPTEHLDPDAATTVFAELAALAHGEPGLPGRPSSSSHMRNR